MRFERPSNWIKHDGERLSPASLLRRGQHGPATNLGLSAFGATKTAPRISEESGPARTPSFRYRSLLVPVDGSPFSEHALPIALGIARRAGAEVRVIHVHAPLIPTFQPERSYHSGLDVWLKGRQERYLDGLVRRLAKVTSVPITPVFSENRDVADALWKAASAGTDLVVMATRRRGPLGRFWFGSVGDALVRRLSVPLLFVRGHDAPVDLTGDPILRHVLITLDGSQASEKVLEPALALGTLTDADHTLLRVIPWATDFSLGESGAEAPSSLNDSEQEKAWSYVRSTAKRLGGASIRLDPRLVLDEESTEKAILRYAQAHDADVIAVATRGYGGWARVFQGSVADRVVRGASVPVLVCRQYTKMDGGYPHDNVSERF
jgi:nucleotide-binding universal stress UspA family protein